MQSHNDFEHNLGNQKNIVIFVHGFGVKRDSRGMFTDIVAALPEDYGWVLFDLYNVVNDTVVITSPSQQVSKIREAVMFAKSRCPEAKVHLIAHSMGCPIAATADISGLGSIIFLAPAAQFTGNMQKYFERYPGTKLVENTLHIPRKDGTTTHIPETFFSEISTLDAQGLMASYAKKHPITVVRATEDGIIADIAYETLVACVEITMVDIPADHNFTGETRQQLIDTIVPMLAS